MIRSTLIECVGLDPCVLVERELIFAERSLESEYIPSHQVRIRCPGEVPPSDEYRRRLVTPMNSLVRFGLTVNLNADLVIHTILDERCVAVYNDPNCIFYARLVTPRLRGRNEV